MIGENKKGLSPLLATILLIAFAVSLGTLVMSWSVEVATQETDTCKNVQLQLQQTPQGEAICYDAPTQNVKFLIKNTAETPIDSVVLRVIDVSQELTEQTLQANLQPGEISQFTVLHRTVSPNNLVASITPQVQGIRCAKEEIEILGVPLC
ncbi:MAG: archaellin/type IV pilin N-terminal domain-containing protein [Candidatus Woesearchaeota archaeon]